MGTASSDNGALHKRILRHRRSSRIMVAQRWKIRYLIGTGSLRVAVAINLHPIEFAIYLRARSVVADRCPIRRLTNRDSRKCQRLDEQVVCPCKRRRILSTLVRTVCINRFV